MRKILVVLLVLSVLGGAFADWWWFDGSAFFGTVIDFDDENGEALVRRSLDDGEVSNLAACCCNGLNTAKFAINWGTEDGISAGVYFDYEDRIGSYLSFSGDNYAFYAEGAMQALFEGWGAWGGLWGWYKFFDGMIHLEAALNGEYAGWWHSDTAVEDLFGADLSYSDMGGKNGILVNFSFEALDFGIFVPGMMDEDWSPLTDDSTTRSVLSSSVIGLNFAMDPVEFGAFFAIENYTAYLGARIFAGDLTLGLSFYGVFDDEEDTAEAMFAVSANYDGGVFGAGVQAGYYAIPSDEEGWKLAISPGFFYNVIPDYMRFVLDAMFTFGADDVIWEFFPVITWNFKGTGNASRLGNWDAIGTGIGIGYRIGGGNDESTINEAYLSFRWSF